jgi:hypothetical protein
MLCIRFGVPSKAATPTGAFGGWVESGEGWDAAFLDQTFDGRPDFVDIHNAPKISIFPLVART